MSMLLELSFRLCAARSKNIFKASVCVFYTLSSHGTARTQRHGLVHSDDLSKRSLLNSSSQLTKDKADTDSKLTNNSSFATRVEVTRGCLTSLDKTDDEIQMIDNFILQCRSVMPKPFLPNIAYKEQII
jgi:hypothetical protein